MTARPHIYFRDRYWRVDPMPRPYHRYRERWAAAHTFVHRLNADIIGTNVRADSISSAGIADHFT